MSPDHLLYFRDSLLQTRRATLCRVQDLEERLNETAEPAIEPEAQRLTVTSSHDRLDEGAKRTIEQIDIAINKMPAGEYGICENCGDEISLKRLEAIPWATLRIQCANDLETKRPLFEPEDESSETAEIPDEYQGLSNNQILGIIQEQIERDGRIDNEELDISLRHGLLYLEGTIAGAPEHQTPDAIAHRRSRLFCDRRSHRGK